MTKDLSCSPRACNVSLTTGGLLQQMLKTYILNNKTESRVSNTIITAMTKVQFKITSQRNRKT